MAELHRLLVKQIARATRSDGSVDLERLCTQVSASYTAEERDKRRIDHANQLMAAEIEIAQQRLQEMVQALEVQNTRFEAALQNMSQGLCMFDRDGRLAICNRRYLDMFQLRAADIVGRPLVEVVQACQQDHAAGQDSRSQTEAYLALALKSTRGVLQQESPDGRVIVIAHEPLPGGGFVHTFDDVTAWRAVDAKMERMASHDALTDLPNRTLLRERLDYALAHRQDGRYCALMCLDLDRFKAVNDSLGHPAGDQLLIQVTQRLRQLVRGTDTVARLGGDEFAILLDGLGPTADVSGLAERLVRGIEMPFDLDGQMANIGLSIGIALAPQDGTDPVTLIKRADLALYQAKAEGRGCFRFFADEMDTAAKVRRELEIDLRRALQHEEFELHYQPQMAVGECRVSGLEALLRWRHPQRGLMPPNMFIPLAEELGLIVPMGEWVMQRACLDAASWPGNLRLAVNVSARQFQNGDQLIECVRRALTEAGLAPQRLEVEITETVLMSDNAETMQTLYRLRELGVHIVMDDFGVGYSSLAYLRSFPFDKIKIDKSFVQEIGARPDAVAIIRAVGSLCASLGIASTAEGIETQEQFDRVSQEDYTEAQGFLFSKPVPRGEVPALLTRLNQAALAMRAERPVPDRLLSVALASQAAELGRASIGR